VWRDFATPRSQQPPGSFINGWRMEDVWLDQQSLGLYWQLDIDGRARVSSNSCTAATQPLNGS
jgi:hypothetical protein